MTHNTRTSLGAGVDSFACVQSITHTHTHTPSHDRRTRDFSATTAATERLIGRCQLACDDDTRYIARARARVRSLTLNQLSMATGESNVLCRNR
jgi:hypothetical protein